MTFNLRRKCLLIRRMLRTSITTPFIYCSWIWWCSICWITSFCGSKSICTVWSMLASKYLHDVGGFGEIFVNILSQCFFGCLFNRLAWYKEKYFFILMHGVVWFGILAKYLALLPAIRRLSNACFAAKTSSSWVLVSRLLRFAWPRISENISSRPIIDVDCLYTGSESRSGIEMIFAKHALFTTSNFVLPRRVSTYKSIFFVKFANFMKCGLSQNIT